MRNVRKVVLLAVAAMAVMAFAASSASAADDLVVTNETGGGSCSQPIAIGTNVINGCQVHAISEAGIVLKKHVFGIESTITTCNNEFHGRVGNHTEQVGDPPVDVNVVDGYIFEQTLSGAGCSRQACQAAGGEGTAWKAVGHEGATLEGNEYLTTNFCVEPVGGGTDESCEIDVPFNETSDHRYEFGHASEMSSHGISGFRCELDGHWVEEEVLQTHDGVAEVHVEVNH